MRSKKGGFPSKMKLAPKTGMLGEAIKLIKSYWFEQSISNSEHTEAQFISENIEHGIKAPSQGLDQP